MGRIMKRLVREVQIAFYKTLDKETLTELVKRAGEIESDLETKLEQIRTDLSRARLVLKAKE